MTVPVFYPGIHILSFAAKLDRCMVSANLIERRRSLFGANEWIMDSGAFTRLARGLDHLPVDDYAALANRFAGCGTLEAVVTQDKMCEPFVLERVGATVAEHQRWTTERWLTLRGMVRPYLMPVIQGWTPADYAAHTEALSPHLDFGQWVGVGSVCKRQSRPDSLAAVLEAIHGIRPDLRLHGFGVKITAYRSSRVTEHLATADSMAWSFAARYDAYHGRDTHGANSLQACLDYIDRIDAIKPDGVHQMTLDTGAA